MKVESKAFLPNQPIPKKYSYKSDNISPNLKITDLPPNTKSLALIMDDPDAPHGTYVHWVTWNIPPDTHELADGIVLSKKGLNHYGNLGYDGPCPPPGKSHRYYFKVYALNTLLELPEGSSKEELEKAMTGHIIKQAELMGTYQQ